MFRSNVINVAKRSFATAKVGAFNPKSTSKIWLGDSGAYPVMIIVTLATIMCGSFCFKKLNHPDARLQKVDRKAIFRAGVEDN